MSHSSAVTHSRSRMPPGAVVVIIFEFFERFGFYSMLALLALFLTATRGDGGFGWSRADALMLLGIYTGLMYALPVLGGAVADRLLGHRRAIAIGGVFEFVGYGLLALPTLIPIFADHFTGDQIAERFAATKVPLGLLAPPVDFPTSLMPAYQLVTAAFWGAIACLVIGNALMKSTLVVILGDNFEPTDPRRDTAYAVYYAGINMGALIAGVVAGTVASSFGWAAAFGTSAIGMAIALFCFTAFGRYLTTVAVKSGFAEEAMPTENRLSTSERLRLFLLSILAVLLFCYHVGGFQLFGSIILFVDQSVNREINGFTIPSQWFVSINAGVLIGAAPLLGMIWASMARQGRGPDIILRYVLALALGGSALLLFSLSAMSPAAGGKSGLLIPAIAVAVQALGEVIAWTSTYGIVYRLAPRRMVAGVMGAFYAITLGLGGYVAGWLGRYGDIVGFAHFFGWMGVATLLLGVLTLLGRRSFYGLSLAAQADLSPRLRDPVSTSAH